MGAISLTPKLPWQLIVEEINQLNTETGANFSLTDLTYAVKSSDNTAGTAVLTLTPAVGTAYFNTRDVNYHRLDLNTWFKNIAVRVYTDGGKVVTVGDAVKLIGDRYGMTTPAMQYFLDPATDFDAADMAAEISFADSGIQTITIMAKNDSLAWYGTLTFKVYNKSLDLANIITNTDLGQLKYVDEGDGAKTSARLLTYPVDLSQFAAMLSAATTTAPLDGVDVDEVLAQIMVETNITVELGDQLGTALKAATPTYNGVTANSPDTGVNAKFANVVIIPLTESANLYGTAVLGYNDPTPPSP